MSQKAFSTRFIFEDIQSASSSSGFLEKCIDKKPATSSSSTGSSSRSSCKKSAVLLALPVITSDSAVALSTIGDERILRDIATLLPEAISINICPERPDNDRLVGGKRTCSSVLLKLTRKKKRVLKKRVEGDVNERKDTMIDDIGTIHSNSSNNSNNNESSSSSSSNNSNNSNNQNDEFDFAVDLVALVSNKYAFDQPFDFQFKPTIVSSVKNFKAFQEKIIECTEKVENSKDTTATSNSNSNSNSDSNSIKKASFSLIAPQCAPPRFASAGGPIPLYSRMMMETIYNIDANNNTVTNSQLNQSSNYYDLNDEAGGFGLGDENIPITRSDSSMEPTERRERPIAVVLIDILGTERQLKIKDFNIEELFKKAGFKTSEEFLEQAEWSCKYDNKDYFFKVYAKAKVKGGRYECKYIFPPPVTNIKFFGTCVVVACFKNNDGSIKYIDLPLSLWELVYLKLMQGSSDASGRIVSRSSSGGCGGVGVGGGAGGGTSMNMDENQDEENDEKTSTYVTKEFKLITLDEYDSAIPQNLLIEFNLDNTGIVTRINRPWPRNENNSCYNDIIPFDDCLKFIEESATCSLSNKRTGISYFIKILSVILQCIPIVSRHTFFLHPWLNSHNSSFSVSIGAAACIFAKGPFLHTYVRYGLNVMEDYSLRIFQPLRLKLDDKDLTAWKVKLWKFFGSKAVPYTIDLSSGKVFYRQSVKENSTEEENKYMTDYTKSSYITMYCFGREVKTLYTIDLVAFLDDQTALEILLQAPRLNAFNERSGWFLLKTLSQFRITIQQIIRSKVEKFLATPLSEIKFVDLDEKYTTQVSAFYNHNYDDQYSLSLLLDFIKRVRRITAMLANHNYVVSGEEKLSSTAIGVSAKVVSTSVVSKTTFNFVGNLRKSVPSSNINAVGSESVSASTSKNFAPADSDSDSEDQMEIFPTATTNRTRNAITFNNGGSSSSSTSRNSSSNNNSNNKYRDAASTNVMDVVSSLSTTEKLSDSVKGDRKALIELGTIINNSKRISFQGSKQNKTTDEAAGAAVVSTNPKSSVDNVESFDVFSSGAEIDEYEEYEEYDDGDGFEYEDNDDQIL